MLRPDNLTNPKPPASNNAIAHRPVNVNNLIPNQHHQIRQTNLHATENQNTTMSSFFTLPGSARKRKRTDATADSSKSKKPDNTTAQPARKLRKSKDDEEISSASEGEDARPGSDDEDSEEEFAGETTAERRLRLAEQYLANVREEVGTHHTHPAGRDAAQLSESTLPHLSWPPSISSHHSLSRGGHQLTMLRLRRLRRGRNRP